MFRTSTPVFVDPDCETVLFVRTSAVSGSVSDPDCETVSFVVVPRVIDRSCESNDPDCNR